MKIFTATALSYALLIGSVSCACAQADAPMASPDAPHNPAVKSPNANGRGPVAAGKNSFTESQASGRIEKAGFTQLTDLVLNDDGLWQGHAMKHGRRVSVSMDFRGHISSR